MIVIAESVLQREEELLEEFLDDTMRWLRIVELANRDEPNNMVYIGDVV